MLHLEVVHVPPEAVEMLISFGMLLLLKWLVLPRMVARLERHTRMIRKELEHVKVQRQDTAWCR